ncbi:MAG: AAA family ATPase, partial [Phycisphaeraceae bacterium]|nr:AAA family ATPase [Phycisphaeraceae bacterium]
GAGKTTALTTAIDAWQSAGYAVIGTAPFAEAARTLEAETGIECRTLEALLQRVELAADPRRVLNPQTVIIVDEASTIGNRQLHRLYRAATETGATVRTIGDPQQHQSVEAGGLWAHLTTTFANRTPVLATNRRQTGPDMAEVRLALDDYRNGLITTALGRLDDDNRIIVADTWDDLLDQMTADWYLDHQRHQSGDATGSQMIAERNADRHALNRRAQAWLRQDGTLTHPARVGDDTFHRGDRVVAQVADKTLTAEPDVPRRHVINGSAGTITGHTGDSGHPDLIVDFDHLGTIRIPYDFIATEVGPGRGGGLTPAYAVTSYKAEGQTYDAARGLAAPGAINTEGMYVALTRGRNDLRVYSIAPADQRTEPPELPIIDDPRAATKALADTLSKWRGADIAIAADPHASRTHTQSIASFSDRSAVQTEGPVVERARRAVEERIAGHAIANPDPVIVAKLGPRPEPGDHRDAWDHAVGQVALYQQRWVGDAENSHLPERAQGGSEQRTHHARLANAITDARLRLAETRAVGEVLDELELVTSALEGKPSGSEAAQSLLDSTTTEHRRNQARLAAAKADHLATSVGRRRNPDAIETARRNLRETEVDVAGSALRRDEARQLLSATRDDPAARQALQQRATSIGQAIELKIVTAVQNPAPYLAEALGPRPPRSHPDRPTWNNAASHLEAYRHKILRRSPDDGPLAPTGVAAAIGPRPRVVSMAKRWLGVAKQAERLRPDPQQQRTRPQRIS